MRLSSLFQRRTAVISDPPQPDAAEEAARARARRRLIGAAVLLVIGVLAFPVLFETQPRPVPVDIPMVIPSREGAAPLSLPPRGNPASGPVVAAAQPIAPPPAATVAPAPLPAPAAAPTVAPPPPAASQPATPVAAATPAVKVNPKPAAEAKAAPKVEAKVEPKAAAKSDSKSDPKPEPRVETKGIRYVIQVGAFGDEASAREARQKVERLGMKTYTQDVEVQGTRRIRVRIGPFESQAEANKALAALKAAKLPGAVLTL